jgi:hypothetical protein
MGCVKALNVFICLEQGTKGELCIGGPIAVQCLKVLDGDDHSATATTAAGFLWAHTGLIERGGEVLAFVGPISRQCLDIVVQ